MIDFAVLGRIGGVVPLAVHRVVVVLRVVHKVLHEEQERGVVGVGDIFGLNASQVAHVAHEPLERAVVAHLGIDAAGLGAGLHLLHVAAVVLVEQGEGHHGAFHVLIDAALDAARAVVPVREHAGDVAQREQRAHLQQTVLSTQARALVVLGIALNHLQVARIVGQRLLGGIIPVVVHVHAVHSLQIPNEVAKILLHLGVAALYSLDDDGIGTLVELVQVGPNQVIHAPRFDGILTDVVGPELVEAVVKGPVHRIAVERTEDVVVRANPGTAGQCAQSYEHERTNGEEAFHRIGHYSDSNVDCRDDKSPPGY